MGITKPDAEALITRAWDVALGLTADHPLVQAIWALEDAVDYADSNPDHAAYRATERVEYLIGELP